MKGKANILCGDVVERLPLFKANTFDAVFCDPPYGLDFMGKHWDGEVPAKEVWEGVLRVLKPGGHLIAFGGTRTYHRLTCAIEDAGFEIRDCLMWLYGQGFPKSMNISKAIDKAEGMVREVIGFDPARVRANRLYEGGAIGNLGGSGNPSDRTDNGATITAPGSERSAPWEGYGTALKPAYEPVVVAMKPLDGTFANNALVHGVAGINVDGCRIGHSTTDDYGRSAANSNGTKNPHNGFEGKSFKMPERSAEYASTKGRFPANVILSHHEDCVCVGTKMVRGSMCTPQSVGLGRSGKNHTNGVYGGKESKITISHVNNEGEEEVEAWECVEDCPVRLLDEHSGFLHGSGNKKDTDSGVGNDFKASSYKINYKGRGLRDYGSSGGGASRFFYNSKATTKERTFGLDNRTTHPTVKPLDVCKWLATLLLPPERDTPRRLLVPFSGVGSEMIGALQAGWDEVFGVELMPEYVEDAKKRIDYWTKEGE